MFRLSGLAGITIIGLALLVGTGSSQDPRESAGQLPSGWSELGLSTEQRAKIQAIHDECKMRIAELERQLKQLQAEQRRKMVAVLNSDQQKTLRGKDMNAEPIIVEQTFRAPIGRVWDAITNKDQMPKWFFNTINDFVPKVGFYTKFNVPSGAKDYLHVWRVMEVVPNRLLTLEWQYGGYPGDSFVTFELNPSGEGTHLKLTHRGFETFPKDEPAFTRESGLAGWTYFICQSLKTFLDEPKK
jgi:uncharacterized protein YndB with AHSA1/START domain